MLEDGAAGRTCILVSVLYLQVMYTIQHMCNVKAVLVYRADCSYSAQPGTEHGHGLTASTCTCILTISSGGRGTLAMKFFLHSSENAMLVETLGSSATCTSQ